MPRAPMLSGVVLGVVLLAGCQQSAAPDPGRAAPPAPLASSPSAAASVPTPYVEPGVVDGAPRDNTAYRRPGELSAEGEKAATAQAERMTPVVQRLWRAGDIDPQAVREELLKLGYRPDELKVQPMYARWKDNGNVTPPGALIGLTVGEDACVTGHVQKNNAEVRASGRFMDTGCVTPPIGH
ncbi:hypothetical protein [Streptomyces sp. NBC_01506]|uniref:hypothetical protein n=1 Tax=Streptomyces sp. NBC_01506 TaxID=2903887 RepID=UPI0038709898